MRGMVDNKVVDDKEVNIHQSVLSSQQRSEAESDKSGPGSQVDSTLEQKVEKENYLEIWDKISSDLDDIIRNTNILPNLC